MRRSVWGQAYKSAAAGVASSTHDLRHHCAPRCSSRRACRSSRCNGSSATRTRARRWTPTGTSCRAMTTGCGRRSMWRSGEMCAECVRRAPRQAENQVSPLLRGGGNGEVACKRDSVSDRLPGRPVTIHLCGLPEGVQLPGRTGRSSPLLGLAPGGVYRADDVTVVAGALLPHRFTLTCDQLAVKRTDPSAVSLCCTCPSGRPNLALASTLPCGVPTFLDDAARTAAITRPPHHCGAECTALCRLGGTDRHSGRSLNRWVRARCRSMSSARASAG